MLNSNMNLQGKTVARENAYEVWATGDNFNFCGEVGKWTWYVLKKYQSPQKEATNRYARWFCCVVTPMCADGELGDVYINDITSVALRVK